MLALVRYLSATTVHQQRFLPPIILYVGLLWPFCGSGSGPLTGTYALASAALLLAGTWLTVLVANAEQPSRRKSTVAAAGMVRVSLATGLCASLACGLLGVLGLVLPAVLNSAAFTWHAMWAGALGLLTALCVGVALGLCSSRWVFPRAGVALIVALGGIATLTLVDGLPPINAEWHLLSRRSVPLAPLWGDLGIAALLLAAACTVLTTVSWRRG